MKTPRIAVFLFAAFLAGIFSLVTASSQSPAPAPRPSWLHSTPLVLVSNHDSMPILRRRVGGNPLWQDVG